jgi:phosphoribosylglycinamide formyltransferase-1
MQALVEAGLPVSAVLSNRADAKGLDFAKQRGIATAVVEHRSFTDRAAFEDALAREIDRFSPRLVALAGFMRVLTAGFVARYRERMLNIHPSLLPAFPGCTRTSAPSRPGSSCTGAPCTSSPRSSTPVRS